MTDAVVSLTEQAIQKVRELKAKEPSKQQDLRVYVTGGGCSGFSYGFKLDDSVQDDDTLIDIDQDLKVLVDSLSVPYLWGSQIDYQKNLMGARFMVTNPNATTTCGCGSSFNIE
jgi:iron-sulfur cluster insertion protein